MLLTDVRTDRFVLRTDYEYNYALTNINLLSKPLFEFDCQYVSITKLGLLVKLFIEIMAESRILLKKQK